MLHIIMIEEDAPLFEQMAINISSTNYKTMPITNELTLKRYFCENMTNFLDLVDLHQLEATVYIGIPCDALSKKTFTLHTSQLVLSSHSDNGHIKLSHNEFKILQTVARAQQPLVYRKQLIEALGHHYLTYDERCLETLISRLRKKLVPYDFSIRAVKSQGYWFEAKILEQK